MQATGDGERAISAAVSLDVSHDGEQVDVSFGDRSYRIRSLAKDITYGRLKVIVRVSRDGAFYLDRVDLVSARQRGLFQKVAAAELGLKGTSSSETGHDPREVEGAA